MTTKNNFLHSLVFLPMIASMFSGNPATPALPDIQATFVKGIIITNDQAEVPVEIDTRSMKIDAYFMEKGLPLAGYGKKLVEEADKRDLDWRLIAAIAMRESTGGKHACKNVPNNYWGWNSCKTGFDSMDKAIASITAHLAGDNPNTSKHYEGKDVKAILQTYNPPRVVPQYADQVMAIMKDIDGMQISDSQSVNTENS